MEMFWARGYEGVSVADLTAAIGIAPPSLYNAFGSKAALFEQAVDLYERSESGLNLGRLKKVTTLNDWVRALLEIAAASVTSSGRGCLISSGMIMCHPDAQAVSDKLVGRRTAFRKEVAVQLERWLPKPEADNLARYLVTVMQGLSVQARDGATMQDLTPTIVRALSAV